MDDKRVKLVKSIGRRMEEMKESNDSRGSSSSSTFSPPAAFAFSLKLAKIFKCILQGTRNKTSRLTYTHNRHVIIIEPLKKKERLEKSVNEREVVLTLVVNCQQLRAL